MSHFTKGMALLLNDRMKLIRAAVQWSVNGQAAIDQGNDVLKVLMTNA